MTGILNVTTIPRLNEMNYPTWHVRMCALLICTELWGITCGKETTPNPKTASAAAAKSFISCQLKAAAKITLYVEDSQIRQWHG